MLCTADHLKFRAGINVINNIIGIADDQVSVFHLLAPLFLLKIDLYLLTIHLTSFRAKKNVI